MAWGRRWLPAGPCVTNDMDFRPVWEHMSGALRSSKELLWWSLGTNTGFLQYLSKFWNNISGDLPAQSPSATVTAGTGFPRS